MLKSEIIKDWDPFVPMLDGTLKYSPIASISKDDDFIIYLSLYAHYQYYGVLFVGPMTGKGAFLIPNMVSGQGQGFQKWKQVVLSIIQRHIILRHAQDGLTKEKNIHVKQWIDAAKKKYKEQEVSEENKWKKLDPIDNQQIIECLYSYLYSLDVGIKWNLEFLQEESPSICVK